jgi:hypothetical protein
MTIQEINTAIIAGTFTATELQSISDAVKFARARVASSLIGQLRKGAQVRFAGRRGVTLTGTVRSMGTKNVVIDTPQGAWRVAATLLEVI